jgi:hypothetical protein
MAFHSNQVVLLRIIDCKWCGLVFLVCRRCYHGQVYCCEQCRKKARRVALRQAQSTYRTSPKGRKTNRLAARKRRIKANQKTVADQPTTRVIFRDIILHKSFFKAFCCSFCGTSGNVVKQFPRRGYGGATVLKTRDSGESAALLLSSEHRRQHDDQAYSQPSENSQDSR